MAPQPSPKRTDDTPAIPDRLYFKIGDVARICGLEPYVLRFWESQFPQLKPNKSGTGQRLYRRRDVELALEIKQLVHVQGYTLSGARQALEQIDRRSTQQPGLVPAATGSAKARNDLATAVSRARAELRAIAGLLASPAASPQRRRSRFAVSCGELFPS